MTQAAEQCREYIEAKYPGVRISRLACRDTTKGDISQHSAYDGYDSNALDIMGVVGGTWDENVALIQEIVDDLNTHLEEWSIRKILWQVAKHYGHAHIDYYPMITMHKWCGGPETPTWRLSNGETITTRDPAPENGPYDGSDTMPADPYDPPDSWAREDWTWAENAHIMTEDSDPHKTVTKQEMAAFLRRTVRYIDKGGHA